MIDLEQAVADMALLDSSIVPDWNTVEQQQRQQQIKQPTDARIIFHGKNKIWIKIKQTIE